MDEAGESSGQPRHRAPGPWRIPQQRRGGESAPDLAVAGELELACLRVLRDGRSRTRRECERAVVATAGVRGPGPEQVGSALWRLVRAGTVRRTSALDYAITDTGRFRLLRAHAEGALAVEDPVSEHDPLVDLEASLERIEREVAAELLSRLRTREPAYVERAVLGLLTAMGYGGADPSRLGEQVFGEQWGRGSIAEDPLGLRQLLVQVVRRGATDVLRAAEVEVFALGLRGPHTDHGVYISTGPVAAEAHEHAAALPGRVTLLDGERLAELMVGCGVGVRARRAVVVPEVDEHFFS